MAEYVANHLQGQVGDHVVEIIGGSLSIDGEQKTFEANETEQFLDILLIWRYGLEKVSLDNLADGELNV